MQNEKLKMEKLNRTIMVFYIFDFDFFILPI